MDFINALMQGKGAKLHSSHAITCSLKCEKQLTHCRFPPFKHEYKHTSSLTCYMNMSVPGTVNVEISKKHTADRQKRDKNNNPRPRQLFQRWQLHLNWKSAQNIPLFLPMVVSVELIVSTFPWAVHRTKTHDKKKVHPQKRRGAVSKQTVTLGYLPLLIQQARTLHKSSTCTDRWTLQCSSWKKQHKKGIKGLKWTKTAMGHSLFYLYMRPLKNMESWGPMTVTTTGATRLKADRTP